MTALKAVWQHKLLWLVHVVGNAAAALAAWWWLGLPESTVWNVALSALAAIVIAVLFLWMHSAALVAYRGPEVPWMRALRRVPLALPWFAAIAAAAIYLHYIWLAVAILLLMPLGAAAWSAYRDWRYYAWAVALLAVGYAPVLLLGWVPQVQGLNAELASLALRGGAAYLIAVTVWLLLAAAAQVRAASPGTRREGLFSA
jgi:hypothetical protein